MARVDDVQALEQVQLGSVAPDGALPEYFVAASASGPAQQSGPIAEVSLPVVRPVALHPSHRSPGGSRSSGLADSSLVGGTGGLGGSSYTPPRASVPAIAAGQVTLPAASSVGAGNRASESRAGPEVIPGSTLGHDVAIDTVARDERTGRDEAAGLGNIEDMRREALELLEKAAPIWLNSSPHGYLIPELREAIVQASAATLSRFAERARTELESAG